MKNAIECRAICTVISDMVVMFFFIDSPGNLNTHSNLIALTEYRGSQLKLDHDSSADAAGPISHHSVERGCCSLLRLRLKGG
jgi:hypothetical protein